MAKEKFLLFFFALTCTNYLSQRQKHFALSSIFKPQDKFRIILLLSNQLQYLLCMFHD